MFAVLSVTIACLLFAALTAFLVTKLKTKYYLKFLLIPAILATALLAVSTYKDLLGVPVDGKPHHKFLFVAYTLIQKDHKAYVELWVRQHGESKLYSFPLSDVNLAMMLRQAEQMTEAGQEVEGSFDGDLDTNGQHKLGSENGTSGYLMQPGGLTVRAIPIQSILPPKK